MTIVSFQFLFFCMLILIAYFVIPKKWQWVVILVANVVFYATGGARFLLYILAASLFTYIAALQIEKTNGVGKLLLAEAQSSTAKKEIRNNILILKKAWCAIGIVISMGIWIVLKYGNFFVENLNALLHRLHIQWQAPGNTWMLPLGISFYTFHAVGYLVDVYREKYAAEKNFLRFFTFISFFPHLTQGPFSRYDQLSRTLYEPHTFSYERFCIGVRRILWGVVKKTLVADKIGIFVTAVFADYLEYSGTQILFSMVFYCIQLYADFSGYMDIVCGFSHILGIEVLENFRQPYFAKSIDEFWRRWHITLGQWFRDYVFYPVSMGKTAQKMGKWARKKFNPKMGKLVPGYFALIFVWTATGLWHGANWTYLIWGYLNLFVILISMQLEDCYAKIKEKLHISSYNPLWNLFSILRTFALVCFFRFFSTTQTVADAMTMIKYSFLHLNMSIFKSPLKFFAGMTKIEILVAFTGMLCILIVDVLSEMNKWDEIKEKCPGIIRNLVYTALIFALILFAGGDNELPGGFMYANF